MKLDTIRFGCAVSALLGITLFGVSLANLIWPTYGVAFLQMFDSIYPGYHHGQWGFGGVLVVTLYALVDGWLMGVILAWLYNRLTKK